MKVPLTVVYYCVSLFALYDNFIISNSLNLLYLLNTFTVMFWLSEFFFIILLLVCSIVFKLFFYNSVFTYFFKAGALTRGIEGKNSVLSYQYNLSKLTNYFILKKLVG